MGIEIKSFCGNDFQLQEHYIMKIFQIAKFKDPIIQNGQLSRKMLIVVQLFISCSLKSDKIKGIHVRIEIETGIGKNDFHGLDNHFSEM